MSYLSQSTTGVCARACCPYAVFDEMFTISFPSHEPETTRTDRFIFVSFEQRGTFGANNSTHDQCESKCALLLRRSGVRVRVCLPRVVFIGSVSRVRLGSTRHRLRKSSCGRGTVRTVTFRNVRAPRLDVNATPTLGPDVRSGQGQI